MFSGLDVVDVRHGRRWTALASFVLQGILVTAAMVLPLLNPSTMPFPKHLVSVPILFGDRQIRVRQENVQQHGGGIQITPIVVERRFTYPTEHNNSTANSEPLSPSVPFGGGGPGTPEGLNSILSVDSAQPVLRPTPSAKPRPVSVVMEGNLLHRVEPQYPTIAKQIRLQGTVVLQAFVTAEGRIDRPKVLSGPGILAQAALEAVKQWQYRPYYLNGQAIEVETQITVKFILNQ